MAVSAPARADLTERRVRLRFEAGNPVAGDSRGKLTRRMKEKPISQIFDGRIRVSIGWMAMVEGNCFE